MWDDLFKNYSIWIYYSYRVFNLKDISFYDLLLFKTSITQKIPFLMACLMHFNGIYNEVKITCGIFISWNVRKCYTLFCL